MTLGEKRVDWAGLQPAPLTVQVSALTIETTEPLASHPCLALH